MTDSQILGIGKANPPIRLTQEESFYATGYQSERIRESFLNSDIEYRHFYFGSTPIPQETSDQQNERYRSGAVHTGCRAIMNCLEAASASVKDVDLLAVCTCTGYVCPDVGSRLIAHMGFRPNVQRATIVGLGCAASIPALQRATDFVRANPGRKALVVAVEICSACYFVDNTLETVTKAEQTFIGACGEIVSKFLLASWPCATSIANKPFQSVFSVLKHRKFTP